MANRECNNGGFTLCSLSLSYMLVDEQTNTYIHTYVEISIVEKSITWKYLLLDLKRKYSNSLPPFRSVWFLMRLKRSWQIINKFLFIFSHSHMHAHMQLLCRRALRPIRVTRLFTKNPNKHIYWIYNVPKVHVRNIFPI